MALLIVHADYDKVGELTGLDKPSVQSRASAIKSDYKRTVAMDVHELASELRDAHKPPLSADVALQRAVKLQADRAKLLALWPQFEHGRGSSDKVETTADIFAQIAAMESAKKERLAAIEAAEQSAADAESRGEYVSPLTWDKVDNSVEDSEAI